MPKKIALINQRYGREVNGGSEYYTRLIAERLTKYYDVDVITTKASEYTTWANYYPDAEEMINGVRVLRFANEKCRATDFDEYNGKYLAELSAGNPDTDKESLWFDKQGPYCPAAIEYIRTHHDDYHAFIFVTYLYYLSVKGIPCVADKAIFIPTAHEEPFIHFKTYQTLFRQPRAYVFLTEEEKRLVQTLFSNRNIPSIVSGAGVDVPDNISAQRFREKYGLDNFIIYVGRIDEGKNCPEMFDFFLEYKKRNFNDLKLVLMGKPVCKIPKHKDIISLGFVSEEDKFDGISASKLLLLPSKFESLSISVLEAMAISVPVIVNGNCAVLKGHCVKSNAGLYYQDYYEFEGAVNYMLEHEREYRIMKSNAKKYVDKNYRWDTIISGLIQIIG